MPDNCTKGGRQTSDRESDRFIVPEKVGNAAGGKETTDGRAEEGSTDGTQRRRSGGNETAPHSSESTAGAEAEVRQFVSPDERGTVAAVLPGAECQQGRRDR